MKIGKMVVALIIKYSNIVDFVFVNVDKMKKKNANLALMHMAFINLFIHNRCNRFLKLEKWQVLSMDKYPTASAFLPLHVPLSR